MREHWLLTNIWSIFINEIGVREVFNDLLLRGVREVLDLINIINKLAMI